MQDRREFVVTEGGDEGVNVIGHHDGCAELVAVAIEVAERILNDLI